MIAEPVQAVRLARALEPYDPLFLEEPIRPEHRPAWRRIREQIAIPLATGESLYQRFEFNDLLASGGADIIQPDICVCGGLSEMRRIANLADAHYVTMVPHNPMGPLATAVNVHFAAGDAQLHDARVQAARGLSLDPRSLSAARRVPRASSRSPGMGRERR